MQHFDQSYTMAKSILSIELIFGRFGFGKVDGPVFLDCPIYMPFLVLYSFTLGITICFDQMFHFFKR